MDLVSLHYPSARSAQNFASVKQLSDSDLNSANGNTNSLAGVGIFFQQDSDTNEVFVKTIVKGGSADRSGIIRVGDVVVRVDHENVEGQPLSTLRTRILGAQGSFVTLGFRRREGVETTFYDVPLMRGSPEYFESLKATQPLQDEIERLKRLNSQLEAQRAQDAAELQRFRNHLESQRQEFDRKFLAMDDLLARKEEEVQRLKHDIIALAEHQREGDMVKSDLHKLKETFMDDARRAEEKESLRLQYIEDLKQKMEDDRQRMETQIRKLEQEVRTEKRVREETEMRESRLAELLRRRADEDKTRKLRDAEGAIDAHLYSRDVLNTTALSTSSAPGAGILEIATRMAPSSAAPASVRPEGPLSGGGGAAAAAVASLSSRGPAARRAEERGGEDDEGYFMA